jgi:hypothetical protein
LLVIGYWLFVLLLVPLWITGTGSWLLLQAEAITAVKNASAYA